MNVVVISGTLSSEPRAQALPSGDELVGFEVTVRSDDGPAESVNVVWFNPPASAPTHEAGAAVVVVGRVRRRFFRAGEATVSRTEVVAERVIPTRHRRRVSRALAGAADRLSA